MTQRGIEKAWHATGRLTQGASAQMRSLLLEMRPSGLIEDDSVFCSLILSEGCGHANRDRGRSAS